MCDLTFQIDMAKLPCNFEASLMYFLYVSAAAAEMRLQKVDDSFLCSHNPGKAHPGQLLNLVAAVATSRAALAIKIQKAEFQMVLNRK